MITLDDLEINNYKIYQDKDLFCLGMDSVLLSNFVLRRSEVEGFFYDKSKTKIADLCSGNIPIPLIICAKCDKDIYIDTFEINEKAINLSKKSIEYNSDDEKGPNDKKLNSKININQLDIKKISYDKSKFSQYRDAYDVITCNPPYMKKGAAIPSEDRDILIARSEEEINFDIICDVANFMLKSGKRFFIVHRPNRFAEIITTLKKYNLEPKVVQFVHTKKDKESNLLLLEARKDAKEDMKVIEPIIIYDENNNYTRETMNIYGK